MRISKDAVKLMLMACSVELVVGENFIYANVLDVNGDRTLLRNGKDIVVFTSINQAVRIVRKWNDFCGVSFVEASPDEAVE